MAIIVDGATQTVRRELFFVYFPWTILVIVVGCFLGKAILDSANLPPITPLHHVHALSMGLWFILLALQSTLVSTGRMSWHRLLGKLSPLLVLAFYATAIPISILNWQRIGDPLLISANTVNLIVFMGFYVAAIVYRRQTDFHKRLMLFASISIMAPAFGRIPEILDITHVAAAPLMLLTALIPLIRDLIVLRKAHRASVVGFMIILLTIPIILGLSASSAWITLLNNMFGS